MERKYGFVALLAVVGVSIVFGMVLGGKLNAPQTMQAASGTTLSAALAAPASGGGGVVAPDFADIVEAALPAVVGVSNTQVKRADDGNDPHEQFRSDPFFRWFFNQPEEDPRGRRPSPERRLGFASGFVISQDGYILTNNHVVEDATRLEVSLNDGSKYEAKTIGADPSIDLALIKIDPKGKQLPVLTLGDSDRLRVGQWVIAIGNPLNFEYTVTAGVVSAKKRRVPIGSTDLSIANFLQTDAAINFGNSGGPLLDAKGRVVGINTAISRANFAEGIGFALPINDARAAAEQLRESGSVKRGFIGITMNQAGINDSAREYYGLPDGNGVIVQDVQSDGPAASAGVRKGDVIRKVDGDVVADNQELVASIASRRPGEKVRLELYRDGKTREVTVTLGSRPDPRTLARGGPGGEPDEGSPDGDSEPAQAKGLGITVEALTPALRQRWELKDDVQGVVVSDVEIDSEAAERGIERDLVVASLNDQPVATVTDWRRIVRALRVGAPVKLEVLVPGQEQTSYVFLRVPESED
jgi:serine protease Do